MITQHGETPQVVTFRSADGIPIGCYRSGSGPTLLAVHCAAADHTAWERVTPRLARHFTVYAMDRRGRGASGDAPEYSLECEFANVAAVMEGIGQPVHLYGHSFGGTCAIEAATRVRNLASLILYEGGSKPPGLRIIPDELIARLEMLIRDGQREEALALFMLTVAGLTPAELEVYQQSPTWAARMATLPTIPRERRAVNDYGTDLGRFSALTVPTLFLTGEHSEARWHDLITALSAVIPRFQVCTLPGQGHTAHQIAPDLLADTLTAFLVAITGQAVAAKNGCACYAAEGHLRPMVS
jgi:pimeloyl-ACP methyl ester carboxylesterase